MAQKKRKPKQHRKLPPGMTYAETLAQQQRQLEAVREAAENDTVDIRVRETTERNLWIMLVTLEDAYGFGPKRLNRFVEAFRANVEEFEHSQEVDGVDYALEKLRQKAEKVTGSKITYADD